MAPNLRDTLETSGGGSIGITIYNPDTGEDEKIWLDENEAISLLNDKDTKEAFLKAIQPGRGTAEQERYKAEMWSWRAGGEKGEKPVAPKNPEVTEELPPEPVGKPLEIAPPGDESEGPQELDYFKSPADVMSDEYDELDIPDEPEKIPNEPSEEVKKAIEGELSPKSDVSETTTPEREAQREIIRRGGDDPYTRKPKQVAITPETFPKQEQESREMFRDYIEKKYGFVDKIDFRVAAKQKVSDMEEEWFTGLAREEGYSNMEISLLDQYKKDPKLKEFMYKWEKFYTLNAEQIYKGARDRLKKLQYDRREEIYQYERSVERTRQEMKEIIKIRKEREEEQSEENVVKDMEAYAKAQEALLNAESEYAKEAAKAKIALLAKRLGIKKDLKEDVETSRQERKLAIMVERWKESGMPGPELERRKALYTKTMQ